MNKPGAEHVPSEASVSVNGLSVPFKSHTNLASMLVGLNLKALMRSPTGQPRSAWCGMGTCFSCCVTIDGIPQQRACMQLCRDGMIVEIES